MNIVATKQETEPFRIERLKQFYEIYKIICSGMLNTDLFIYEIKDHKGCLQITWLYEVPYSVKFLAGYAWMQVGESQDQVIHKMINAPLL